MKKMYSFDEIGLLPTILSPIEHRGDVNPFIDDKLPIFVAPMTCILDRDNFETFNKSKFIPILPVSKERLHSLDLVEDWQALTLDDFSYFFNNGEAVKDFPYHILIDCANGHMERLFKTVMAAKEVFPNIVVMVGNIANPETYIECCRAHIDYVRVGIGGGSGCTTSVQTGFHASLPWLLETIKDLKDEVSIINGSFWKESFENTCESRGWTKTKIVADGGINSIDKAIKALALGADYVMMGRCFAQCEEACGKKRGWCDIGIKPANVLVQRHYYGQSSEQGQLDRFGKVKSNPEGTEVWVSVDTTLQEFEDKFIAALRSAMSYAGAKTLNEFIGKVKYQIQSVHEYILYNK